MSLPYYHVNVFTGIKSCRVMEDPQPLAKVLKKAERPLMVFGPKCNEVNLDGKLLMEYGVEIAKTLGAAVCATANTKKKLLELGVTPDSTYDAVEIVNHLKDPNWKGVKKQGNHDFVLFLGVRPDLGNQGLSTLKHFATHLKTVTLCKYVFPNATFSLPNLKDDKWKEYLENLIQGLKS
ncbi:MAG: CO dehydrogenase/acetyl-CoA synthase complex subunit epsilon [Thermodesulfobacteriota bacterium]|nr:CO dehydrogenase/acetyl-CoA synthase complex subunit epsilon [Thermodesulfobacteriota bacterium]